MDENYKELLKAGRAMQESLDPLKETMKGVKIASPASDSLKEASKNMKRLTEQMADVQMPDISKLLNIARDPIIDYPVSEVSLKSVNHEMNRNIESIAKSNRENLKREKENNESLKNLVINNEKIVEYNSQLVSLNENILSKLNRMSSSMDNVARNIKEGNISSDEYNGEQTRLLLELTSIMNSEDKGNKLPNFLKGMAGDVATGLITAYFQQLLGI